MVIYIFLKIFSKYKRLIYFFSAFFQNLFKIQMVAYIFLKIFFQNIKDLYIFSQHIFKIYSKYKWLSTFFPNIQKIYIFFLKIYSKYKRLIHFSKIYSKYKWLSIFYHLPNKPNLCILIFTNSLLIPALLTNRMCYYSSITNI